MNYCTKYKKPCKEAWRKCKLYSILKKEEMMCDKIMCRYCTKKEKK